MCAVTEYQITSWRELPSMVVARQGETTVKVSMTPRFQEAIDEAAMRLGQADANTYLAGWARGPWTAADGSPADVVATVIDGLEEQWSPEAVTAYLDALS